MRAFIIFLVGTAIAVAGVSYGMIRMGVPTVWIGVLVAVIVGVAIASGAKLALKDTRTGQDGGSARTDSANNE
ncbi:hypothetical protein ACWCOP_12050 [Maricaulaceae bacterium MS644]